MTLPSGTRLGPYEIVAPIGAGGMGEVYKARDTRLERDVALKVLPAAVAIDPERLRRFEQEARATAALNHPNLLAVFDVGAEAGVNYLVSELLEGETVRERLKTGPLPVRKAVELAAQIGRGLAAAHDKGIVHRDLKPENLFITRDGRLKILDFGIAKLTVPAASRTIAPTIERGTTPGVVLGTVGYMSPEQVRGLDADHRSDIFALGGILYEMLTGRRAFAGATEADSMSAILTADPPAFGDAGRGAPPILDRIVRRCLEKIPEERFQSASDLAFDLESMSTTSHATGSSAAVEAPAVRSRVARGWLAAALALGLVMGAAATWALTGRTRGVGTGPRFQQLTFRRGTIASARFSPDGDTIAYSAAWDGRPQELYSTRVGSIGEQRALGIQGELLAISKAGEMAVLRDVRTLASNMRAGTLARAPLAGGAPRDVLHDVSGADWSPDGQQLAVTRFSIAQRRWRLEFPIGTILYDTTRWIEQPRVSRDGTRILLLEHPPGGGDNRGRVIQVTVKGVKTDLTREYSSVASVAWAPSGDEAWLTATTFGMRLDLVGIKPDGSVRDLAPAPSSIIVHDVTPSGRVLLSTLSFKARMLVRTPADIDERDITWLDYPVLRDMSADGTTILFEEQGGGGGPNYSVFVRRTDGAPAVRIGDGYARQLSPDLQWALTSGVAEPPNAITITPLGVGDSRTLTVPLEGASAQRWFPDGKRLAINGHEAGKPTRVYEYAIADGRMRPLTPDGVIATSISPDGRTLTVTAADGKALLWPIDGGSPREIAGLEPQDAVLRWATDGGSVFVSSPRSVRTRDIARLDLVSGRRQVHVRFGPSDAAGVPAIAPPVISADGRTYAYRYTQLLSDLFAGDGIR